MSITGRKPRTRLAQKREPQPTRLQRRRYERKVRLAKIPPTPPSMLPILQERCNRLCDQLQQFLDVQVHTIAGRKRAVVMGKYHVLKQSALEIRIFRITSVGTAIYQELLPRIHQFAHEHGCRYHHGTLILA